MAPWQTLVLLVIAGIVGLIGYLIGRAEREAQQGSWVRPDVATSYSPESRLGLVR
jgi:cytochrome c oxidase assembly factor CtaG